MKLVTGAPEVGMAYVLLYAEQKAKNPSLKVADYNRYLRDTLKSNAAAAKPNAKKGKK